MKTFCRKGTILLFASLLFGTWFSSSVIWARPLELVFVRVPAALPAAPSDSGYTPLQEYVDGCQIVRLAIEEDTVQATVLTREFLSARDPAVSFDGKEILFTGKKNSDENWRIWRMDIDGGNKRKITQGPEDCFSPLYVGTLFYLNDKNPVSQITYASTGHGWRDGPGKSPALALYASRPDGSHARRITFNLFSDFGQDVLANGRLVYSSFLPNPERKHYRNGAVLLAVNNDGTDMMAYAERPGKSRPARHQVMPRISSADNRVYFIESRLDTWLGGGVLAFVSQTRPLHSRKILASDPSGYFHSPCPLPVGGLLISHRPKDSGTPYAIWRIDTNTGEKIKLVHAESEFHCIDTQLLMSRPRVQGRSSIVGFRHEDTGVFFCLSGYISELDELKNIPRGDIGQLRVIEGVPEILREGFQGPPADPSRVLGTVPVEPDGSFHIRVPSQTPLAFELIDNKGNPLARQYSWSWVMPGESRGCIGCHEDREMAPPNVLARALVKPEVVLESSNKIGEIDNEQARGIQSVSQCRACH